jgi:uncharacterized membrane protein (UPF0127 family)
VRSLRAESSRLSGLPTLPVLGIRVPVAETTRARLLGLALLDRGEAGPGLLIPRCRSVHTFGMRFDLDLVFLDATGRPIESRRRVPPRRLRGCRAADAVLELPSRQTG